MSNVVVVGAQWGDEGKGKIVDWLAEEADIVVRYNGGHNAGHTLVVNGQTYKLALLPSGIVRGKPGLIGNGVALDPEALLAEIDRMASLGIHVTPQMLQIAETATLVLPVHRAIDAAQERLRTRPIGTTLRGIGPAYEDKVGRRGLRVCDLAEPESLAQKLDALLDYHNAWFRGLGLEPFPRDRMVSDLLKIAPRILPYMGRVWEQLDNARASGKRTVFEGSQAVMLDVDWGSYPYVTSSSTVAASAASGTGIAPSHLGRILGVSKVYATRVGEGPFTSEVDGTPGDLLRQRGGEYGVNTGRPRRCGWLDIVQLRQSSKVAGIDLLALTKLDVLDGFDSIYVCTGYELDGNHIDYMPSIQAEQQRLRPVLVRFDGWDGSTRGIRSFDALPREAAALIEVIQQEVGIPVSMVTTGPERDDVIVLRSPFADRAA
ncbi:adenylosuccinate synthase [Paraburkholderia caribensis]|jgi:adenylosuccinate synthase|uniref:adenylosuccinate synthase n=1 Tax=Paraburkholderia caribensis TaxID=75105 RepID=UPI001CB18977|nr:adenylosuccinate synthase [Paraburkholderia caribensis]CAG9270800.1 Adenylosuccinate synthetase 2 [Paraburkholderia caribensis]